MKDSFALKQYTDEIVSGYGSYTTAVLTPEPIDTDTLLRAVRELQLDPNPSYYLTPTGYVRCYPRTGLEHLPKAQYQVTQENTNSMKEVLSYDEIKVGQEVHAYPQDHKEGMVGMVGEIDSSCIYIHNNTKSGSTGNIHPSKTGYLYSWCVTKSSIQSGASKIFIKDNALKAKPTKNMSIIEKAKLIMKKEPNKTFIKAGIMDMNDNLTSEGKELFINYLLTKNQDDFKATVVDPIIAEQEAEKK